MLGTRYIGTGFQGYIAGILGIPKVEALASKAALVLGAMKTYTTR